MTVVKWTIEDPVDLELVEFEINPSEGGVPDMTKNISTLVTAAPEGRALAFEGRSEVAKGRFSGVILTEDEYNFFVYWYEKRHQVYLTDDLGRVQTVYFTNLQLTRKRAVQFPWKHDYTMEFIILDWVD